MGINFTSFGNPESIEKLNIASKENAIRVKEFDSTKEARISGLVKFEVINKKFSMYKLLKDAGCNPDLQVFYCPFHDDEATGKPSAKYHSDNDTLYCFSESKVYSAYHALKLLYNQDMNKLFHSIWSTMSVDEKNEYLDSNDAIAYSEEDVLNPIWTKYEPALQMFSENKITYSQMKNGIYNIMLEVYNSDKNQNV